MQGKGIEKSPSLWDRRYKLSQNNRTDLNKVLESGIEKKGREEISIEENSIEWKRIGCKRIERNGLD